MTQAQKQTKEMSNHILASQKHQQTYWNSYFKNNKHATRLTEEFSGRVRNLGDVQAEALKKVQKPFAGWAMSIMFAGMALQRFSMSIYKFGTKAFQEISHSVEGTVTNTDMLQGSMKYLGFTVGQALEPVVAFLIPIIDKISEWVERNPKLTATITTLGIALGSIFMVGGMGVLAINGFIDLASKISLMGTSATVGGTNVTSLGTKLNNLGKALQPGSTLMTALGAGLAIAAVLRMFGKDWKNSTPTVGDWLTNLGMTTAAGFMIGGVPGALVGFVIGAVLMVSQEAIKSALKQIENFATAQQAIQEKFARGEILTAEEAYKINFKGTVLPSGYKDRMQEEYTKLLADLREGSDVWKEEQRRLEESMRATVRGEYAGSAYEQQYGSRNINIYGDITVTGDNSFNDLMNGIDSGVGI
jgi:hypothetical protein